MSFNNKVQLSGFLGQDPKEIAKSGKNFTVLQVATTDSYAVKQDKQTKWEDKETIWHDVFVFRPTALKIAKDLKKGDKVELSGSLSYRLFKDEAGITRKQATIVANFIEKVGSTKQDKLIQNEINDLVEKMTA
jgi:single-strand DNA-binding protein